MHIEENMTIEQKIEERKKYPIIVEYHDPKTNIVSIHLVPVKGTFQEWVSVKRNRKFANKILKLHWKKQNKLSN